MTGLSGTGKALLAGGAALGLLDVQVIVTTMGSLSRTNGSGDFPRLHQVGWVGMGFDGGGPGLSDLYWGQFILYPNQDWRIYPLQVFADSYFYDLEPGVVITMEVDW